MSILPAKFAAANSTYLVPVGPARRRRPRPLTRPRPRPIARPNPRDLWPAWTDEAAYDLADRPSDLRFDRFIAPTEPVANSTFNCQDAEDGWRPTPGPDFEPTFHEQAEADGYAVGRAGGSASLPNGILLAGSALQWIRGWHLGSRVRCQVQGFGSIEHYEIDPATRNAPFEELVEAGGVFLARQS